MDYVQALLLEQAEMAESLGTQTEMALRELLLARRRREARDGAENPEQTGGAAGQAAEEADGGVMRRETEQPQQTLWRRMEDAAAAASRAAAMAEERRQAQTWQTQRGQSVSVPQETGSRFSGGVTGELTRRLETSGIAGRQTQRSMAEISRYFERDARRYGG